MYLHHWKHQESYGWCCVALHGSNNVTIRASGSYKELRANYFEIKMQQAMDGWPLYRSISLVNVLPKWLGDSKQHKLFCYSIWTVKQKRERYYLAVIHSNLKWTVFVTYLDIDVLQGKTPARQDLDAVFSIQNAPSNVLIMY